MQPFLYVVVLLFLAACAAPSGPMTSSERDALYRQISSCWFLPMAVEDVKDIVVQLRVLVNPDRTVEKIEIFDQERYNQDPTFRAVAESARQAIEKCSPLNLPPDKYDVWRELLLNFSPQDAITSTTRAPPASPDRPRTGDSALAGPSSPAGGPIGVRGIGILAPPPRQQQVEQHEQRRHRDQREGDGKHADPPARTWTGRPALSCRSIGCKRRRKNPSRGAA
jgi:hypothetical protein